MQVKVTTCWSSRASLSPGTQTSPRRHLPNASGILPSSLALCAERDHPAALGSSRSPPTPPPPTPVFLVAFLPSTLAAGGGGRSGRSS